MGFDFTNWQVIDPGISTTSHKHDFMSYGADRWTSTVTWRITMDHPFVDSVDYKLCRLAIPFSRPPYSFYYYYDCGLDYDATSPRASLPSPPTAMPAYLVSGRIDSNHVAHLSDAYEWPLLWAGRSVQPGTPDVYRLEAVDEQGNTLLAKNFQAQLYSQPLDGFVANFQVMIEKPSRRIASIKVLDGLTEIGTMTARTSGPPSIQITSIGDPGVWRRGEVRHVTWKAGGGEDAMLTARVEYAPGEPGKSGRVLAANVKGGALDVPVQTLPASKNARIVVRASNGIDTTVAMSDPFEVEETGPTVVIIDPPADITVAQRVPVSLFGLGADDQASIADASLVWESSLSGALGTRSHLTVNELPVGNHLITFTARGQNEIAGTATVHVTVLAEDTGGGCGASRSPPPAALVLGVTLLLCCRRRCRCARVTSARAKT